MTLRLATAGESHGPALVAILTGLPAGLELERDAIDADLKRRQQGYGRSPRQQIEQDQVEVLAGLRHGRTLGTPLALLVRNADHKNWAWGMSPWLPAGDPQGKGTKPVTLPRPGHADLAGVQKFGHDDVRNALERASARHTAVHVAAGAVAKALIAAIGISVTGSVVDEDALRAQVDEARAERDTVGGVVEVRATGAPPGLGSYAAKEDRLDARLALALMGIQAVKGVEIGDGFAAARLRGEENADAMRAGPTFLSNHAGGILGGISTGQPVVVRVAFKPTSSILTPMPTIGRDGNETEIVTKGRHDPCVGIRAAPIVEAMMALVLADQKLLHRAQCG
jgi:chorismate synthase